MPRSFVVLLVGGSIGLLVALVALLRSITHSDAPAQHGQAPGETTSAAPPRTGAEAIAERIAIQRAAIAAHRDGPSAAAPSVTPEEGNGPPGTMANTKNLDYGATQMRYQTLGVEPAVRKCVTDAPGKPSGAAIVTFVVARHGDKYVIEDTGVDSDKTSLQDQKLLDCLRETARGMTFVGLPREAEAVVISRSIKIEGGVLTEHKLSSFSYIH